MMLKKIAFPRSLVLMVLGITYGWHVANELRADERAFQVELAKAVRAAADHVFPSVVAIEVIGTSGEKQGEVEQDAPTSGVIVDPDGFILVSSLVTERPSATILVVLPDGSRHAAVIIAEDHHRDLVLLKINADRSLPAIELPEDSSVIDERPIGSTLISIGRYGAEQSPMVSTGIFSARGRLDGIALQTDARVSPAMYGGPMLDLYGNVLGVLIPAVAEGGAETSTSWYDSGIAFAIPTDVIARKIDRLKQGQDIKKGVVGIVAGSRDLNAANTTIAAVRARSPAQSAGILAGDEVISVDGTRVRRHQEIRQVLGSFDAGENVRLRLRRATETGNKEFDVEITLADSIPPLQPQRLGVVVMEAPAKTDEDEPNEAAPSDDNNTNSAKQAVMIDSIVPESAASDQLQVGDQIVRLGTTEIDSALTLRRQLISLEPEQKIEIHFIREGKPRTAQLEPQSIAGPYGAVVPDPWLHEFDEESVEWESTEIKLPSAANAAAFTMPTAAEAAADDVSRRLGLLMLLLEPGKSAPLETIDAWREAAASSGVVVCAVASEDPVRWQPKELATISEFAKAIQKKANIDPTAIAVGAMGALANETASAADSMALAVAFSQSEVFFGVAIASDSKTPAVRLRENEPANSLQILMSAENEDDLPTWAPALEQAGYPISWNGEVDQTKLLDWVRLLQVI